MNISVIGAGYVGLVTGACFSDFGNTVYCVDADEKKIHNLNQGIIPIYEPGLTELVESNKNEERLIFTTDIQVALQKTDICFIAVGTPMDTDGSADLRYVLQVAHQIGSYMDHEMIIVDKSTVPIGTGDKVAEIIASELAARNKNYAFQIVSNPEFLKEGSAIGDFLSPDRVVVGASDAVAAETMKELYAPLIRNRDCFITMDVKSAEMTKYASNAMLATRISFMNEIANLCEIVGADVNKVRLGMGSDRRIGYSFLYAGCGYGGSCFPKDVQALIKTAKDSGYQTKILEQVENVNEAQKMVIANKVVSRFGGDLTGKIFAVWGVAFKPNTDDVRSAPSVVIIKELLRRGARVRVYDPKALDEAKEKYLGTHENLSYIFKKYAAIENADALLLITEWKEFKSPDFERIKNTMHTPIIFDGRNQYKPSTLKKYGFEYYPIGIPV